MSKAPYHDSIEQYREVFEEVDDIIVIIDRSGRIEYVNRALRKQLGYQKKRFTGTSILDCLYDPEGSWSKEEFLKQLFRNRDFETRITVKGDRRHLSWKTKIFSSSEGKRLFAIVRDISEKVRLQKKSEKYSKNLQEMVYKRTQQLEKEKQKAVDHHEAKALFLSKMSHELRTPLTSICGYIDLLQDDELSSAEREKYIDVIDRNARTLLEMVNDTLDMVKLEQDKFSVAEKHFNLRQLLEDIQETYAILAAEKNLKLRCIVAPQVPEWITSDPKMIRQILINLIGNAMKFTHQGGILLKVKQRTFPHKHIQKLYFYLEDTGLGIPKEYQKRVFQSFEQYLDHQVVTAKGTGLGLAISRQFARLLGGNVKLIHSEPNKGSTFMFSLPVREPSEKKKQ